MPWIEFDELRRLEFNAIEHGWLCNVPATDLSPQYGPTVDGKMRVDASVMLFPHLRDLGFPFAETR